MPNTIGDLKDLQKLELTFCENLEGRHHQLSFVAPMLHIKIAFFAGLPETIGKLKDLQKLDLTHCQKLEGRGHQLSFVVPVLHSLTTA